MNIKEQIEQLEEYAQSKSDFKDGTSDFSQGFVAGQRDAAELALSIIKKQGEILNIALDSLNWCSCDSSTARTALEKIINKLLEENV